MTIQLQFIDFIVPRSVIVEKYPSGWIQCLKNHESLIGGRIWHDEYLFRDGAMNPMDIEALVNKWKLLGFNTHKENEDGIPIEWLDVCVCESLMGGPALKYEWLDVDSDTRTASLKGSNQGKNVGIQEFVVANEK